MNIRCLMKKDPDATIRCILDMQKREHAVTVVDIRKDKNYDKIVELIFSSNSVISWQQRPFGSIIPHHVQRDRLT
mgnify:CR=1 FL=1